jgi:hypothetical protein
MRLLALVATLPRADEEDLETTAAGRGVKEASWASPSGQDRNQIISSRYSHSSVAGPTAFGSSNGNYDLVGFCLTNDPFCSKYKVASRVGLRPSPTCQTGQGGSRSGMRP